MITSIMLLIAVSATIAITICAVKYKVESGDKKPEEPLVQLQNPTENKLQPKLQPRQEK